ncbi:hypothetical protein K7432_005364 [Basidiobolus ranarum]|uniref:Uncharacterized protein n=1 Tax=Basidiobolus ranarum TaxID=34480 RepID=A0ABR2WWS8_9FUNG
MFLNHSHTYGLQELPSEDDDAFAPGSEEYREDIGFRNLGAENPEDEQFDAIFDIGEEHENFMEWAGDEESFDEENAKKPEESNKNKQRQPDEQPESQA